MRQPKNDVRPLCSWGRSPERNSGRNRLERKPATPEMERRGAPLGVPELWEGAPRVSPAADWRGVAGWSGGAGEARDL